MGGKNSCIDKNSLLQLLDSLGVRKLNKSDNKPKKELLKGDENTQIKEKKRKEKKIKDTKVSKPALDDFLKYCQEQIPEKYQALKFSLEAKYSSWDENDWEDGNGKPIKNWKTKIKNTIPYLKPFHSTTQNTVSITTENTASITPQRPRISV